MSHTNTYTCDARITDVCNRYFYLADPSGGNGGDKEASELWSFAAAVLPRVHECSETVADLIRANSDISSTDAPMSGGYEYLKEQLESTYSCMGISCSQVPNTYTVDCVCDEYFVCCMCVACTSCS